MLKNHSFANGCITSYTNPDLDGIGSMLGQSFYLETKGLNYSPVYFGTLNNETVFILNYLNIPYPKPVVNLDEYDRIIIVDTHSKKQLSPIISPEKVTEIIDHHSTGDPGYFPNARIIIEDVGAACSVITERFKNEKILLTDNIARLLSFGIISNTLNFATPSTTQRDIDAFEYLKTFVFVSDDLIVKLFESRSDIKNMQTIEIFEKNMKVYKFRDKKIGITQIELIDTKRLLQREDFKSSLIQLLIKSKVDYLLFSGINIINKTTTIVFPNTDCLNVFNHAMGYSFNEMIIEIEKIILRSPELVPKIKKYFEENHYTIR